MVDRIALDALAALRRGLQEIERETQKWNKDGAPVLAELERVTGELARAVADRPPSAAVTAAYMNDWAQYQQGKIRELSPRAVRALCWEPRIATDSGFVSYLSQEAQELRPRAIQGLVRSWHLRWPRGHDRTRDLSIVGRIVSGSRWDHPVLVRWRGAPKGIIGQDAVQWAAEILLDREQSPREFAEDWAIADSSAFLSESIGTAVLKWIRQSGTQGRPAGAFVLTKLMTRQAWPPESQEQFKTVVSKLVEGIDERETDWRRQVTEFVVTHEWLGDPRPVVNQIKWAGMNLPARQRVVRWLSEADIRTFFHHVLPAGDAQRRRAQFWLQYVDSMEFSRVFLSELDAERWLRSQEGSRRGAMRSFGRMRGQNSVFILGFRQAIAVEFSRVGAVYIYSRDRFREVLDDVWTEHALADISLKDRGQAMARAPHQGAWQDDLANTLARVQVRPGSRQP